MFVSNGERRANRRQCIVMRLELSFAGVSSRNRNLFRANPSIRANRVLHARWYSSARFQFAQITATRFVTKYRNEKQRQNRGDGDCLPPLMRMPEPMPGQPNPMP